MKIKETVCQKCLKAFRNNNFARHERLCDGGVIKIPKIIGVDYDPNAGYKTGRQAWNKGLTNADPRVAAISAKVSTALRGSTQTRIWTEEQRLAQSAIQSERLRAGYADGTRKQAGGFVKWYNFSGKMVQGTWELRAAKILDSWKELGKIKDWTHGTTRIKYSDINGIERIYTVDFTVEQNNGTLTLIEVKGRIIPNDELKWAEARKHFEFEIWNLSTIESLEKDLVRV